MARTYGVSSFQEEKQRFLQQAQIVSNWDTSLEWNAKNWEAEQEFKKSFANGSPQLRADRAAAMAAATLDSSLLEHCSPTLRDDADIALAAIASASGPGPLAFVGEGLRGDKDFVLEVFRRVGWKLEEVGEELRNDRDVVLEALRRGLGALEDVSEELQDDKEVVLTAIESDPEALGAASAALREDREVVLKALICWTPEIWGFTSKKLNQDKDFLLLAMRSTPAFQAKEHFLRAAPTLRASFSWEHAWEAACSDIAGPGETAPVLTTTLSFNKPDEPENEGGHVGSFVCLATLLSGKSLARELPVLRGAPPPLVVNDMAKILRTSLSSLREAETEAEAPKRVFIVLKTPENQTKNQNRKEATTTTTTCRGGSSQADVDRTDVDPLPLSPWDFDRPLTDFIT